MWKEGVIEMKSFRKEGNPTNNYFKSSNGQREKVPTYHSPYNVASNASPPSMQSKIVLTDSLHTTYHSLHLSLLSPALKWQLHECRHHTVFWTQLLRSTLCFEHSSKQVNTVFWTQLLRSTLDRKHPARGLGLIQSPKHAFIKLSAHKVLAGASLGEPGILITDVKRKTRSYSAFDDKGKKWQKVNN